MLAMLLDPFRPNQALQLLLIVSILKVDGVFSLLPCIPQGQ